jgi:organic radical activating enzyme
MGYKTAVELAHEIRNTLKTDSNPEGLFLHPVTKQRQHFCVTGGEPLMKHAQEAFIGIMCEFARMGDMPASVTFETNGTQPLTQDFKDFWEVDNPVTKNVELFFSVSPKLWSVAGEQSKRAIKPELVEEYRKLSTNGQLKFVVGSEQQQWDEMESVISQFKDHGVDWSVWVMPVGAREEEQTATAGEVAKKAFQRGYNVAARVHVYLFGNAIGT